MEPVLRVDLVVTDDERPCSVGLCGGPTTVKLTVGRESDEVRDVTVVRFCAGHAGFLRLMTAAIGM